MAQIIETVELISKTMGNLIDFIVQDETLSNDFEEYIIKNKIEITKDAQLNDTLINYILDGKMQDGARVLDYFILNNNNCDKKILSALKESVVSIYQIQKISKNSYEAKCIIQKKSYTLIPLVRTVNLRGIGLFDYIKARVIKLDNTYYLLEISDCIGQYHEYQASVEAVKLILKNPKLPYIDNIENSLEIKKQIANFNSSFLECFGEDEIITSNSKIDKLLADFYSFHKGEINKIECSELNSVENFDYFEIEEFENEDFIQSAINGFSSSKKPYNIGFYSDFELGLFIIPFLGTVNKILEGNEIKNSMECIRYFVLNDKTTPNLLRKKYEKYPILIDKINAAFSKNHKTIDEIIDFYKKDYIDNLRFSAINTLFNSEIFSKISGHKENTKIKNVGRNELCPCGSGKKYKKCCALKDYALSN